MQVSYKQARRLIIAYIKAGLVPMVEGSPGIGKSAIVHSIAREFNLLVIDLRLAQCDPTDLLGFPKVNGMKAGYVPMETFPIEGDELPINPETGKPYAGWLLFLDELTSANRAVQAAAYKLILDRMVGQHKLHKNVAIVAAGNKESDGAIVETMSTALQSRLQHMELVLDVQEWLDHSHEAGYDHRIGDYIKFKSSQLYTFKPDHTDKTYACPRTWEFASKLLKGITDLRDKDTLPLLAGTLSEGVAREFLNFCRVYRDLPKVSEIMANPGQVEVPVEPSILYALTGTLANHAKMDNIAGLMKYIRRLGKEFQVITLKEIMRRNGEAMTEVPAVVDWIAENGEALF
jgi:hypothetical protein